MRFNLSEIFNKNIAFVTHEDLDGIGCYETIKTFLGAENIPMELTYAPDSQTTYNLIVKIMAYKPDTKVIFVTDRDINREHIEMLMEKYSDLYIIHIDHHKNSKHFCYDRVIGYYGKDPDKDYSKCAAELCVEFCEMFLLDFKQVSSEEWFDILYTMKVIGDWDTFRWKGFTDRERIMEVKGLMAMEKIYGPLSVFEKIRSFNHNNYLTASNEEFKRYSSRIYKEYKKILDDEYNKALASLVIYNGKTTDVAIMFNVNTLYLSLLANRYFEEKKKEPIIICIYPSGLISARGDVLRNTKNLQELMMKTPGKGGGHFNAAGGKILEVLDPEFTSDDRTKEFNFRDKEHKDELLNKLIKFLDKNI